MSIALVLASLALVPAAPPTVRADRMVLDPNAHVLSLYKGDKLIRSYKAGIGSEKAGKEFLGDLRTPVGTYRVFKGRASKFNRFLPINYPNVKDAKRGLQQKLINKKQYRAILRAHRRGKMPPQNTRLGGAIGIHGFGRALSFILRPMQHMHQWMDGTEGCVLVTDDEIEEIESLYEPGATLVILPVVD